MSEFKVSFKYLLGGITICREKSESVLLIKCVLKKLLPPLHGPGTLNAYYFICKKPPAATDNET